MIKKRFLSLALLTLFVTSCSNNDDNSLPLSESQISASESQISASENTSDYLEADPYGFDPNFDYAGTSATEFRLMAARYVANPEFVPEPYRRKNDLIVRTLIDFGLITFPYKGSSVVAYHKGNKIVEVYQFKSGKMTISEAKRLGYVGEEQEKQSEAFVYYMSSGGKPSSTKRYEGKLNPNLGTYSHYKKDEINRYIDFFTKYGIPTSMFVYYDAATDDYIKDVVGNGYVGLAVDYASAIPIYSNDLTEIAGVMTFGYHYGSVSTAFVYLKEDGFNRIKKVKEIINEVCDPEIETIQNPCFYVEDTATLPKGDWRLILGYPHSESPIY